MVIDFHTHIFPDSIAPRAIRVLAEGCGLAPSADGTAEGLLASMEAAEIDLSVVLPVVTDPRHFDSMLRFAVRLNGEGASGKGRLISLAGIHPDCDHIRAKLRQIAREGIRGIKLHPDYQRVCIDDIRFLRIFEAASEEGLFVLTHAGQDPSVPDGKYSSPDRILRVLREVHPRRLILAHMGSNQNYPESLEKLCGREVFMDTAYCLADMPAELFVRMVQKHGADKILFATDCPWGSQKIFAGRLRRMPGLSPEEKEQILHKNAARLLGLKTPVSGSSFRSASEGNPSLPGRLPPDDNHSSEYRRG